MDASSLRRKSKRRKRINEKNINRSSRTLSELPDNVLLHIVSFLPPKQAVRTSILSRRWQYIWTSIPTLDFEQGLAKMVDFMNVVERAFLHRGSSNITKFYLKGEVDDLCHVEGWISAAVKCNIQACELELDNYDESLSLPLSLVNCGTLTELSIDMCGMLKFPSPICLSSLKKLELQCVTFPDEHSTQQLFSGCPVLEDLALDYCNWENVTTVSVLCPRLQNFTMIEVDGGDQSNSYGSEFVILGSDLKSLYYRGGFYFDYCLVNSALLEKVSIFTHSCDKSSRRVSDRYFKLLRSISDVPNMMLGSDCVLLLADESELLDHMPIFTHLWCLQLDYESSDLTNIGLSKILQKIPSLKCLVFDQGINISSADANEDGIFNPVPPCFLDHLDFIAVYIQSGDDRELNAVKALLRNAVVLTKMEIFLTTNLAEDTKNKFCVELLKLPRGSRDCGIHIA